MLQEKGYISLFLVNLLFSHAESICTYGDVHLVGGSGDYEGNVQVCVNGIWGYVCDNSWDSNDAQVVCSQLGYSTSFATEKYASYYGYGNGTIWMDYLYCNWYEAKLIYCHTGVNIGATTCCYNEIAGVFCPFGGSACTHGDIRLSTFNSYSYGRSEGRVEVCYNNEWGTVCDDHWGSNDATVACKQLGYNDQISYHYSAYYGAGIGDIWLDDVNCLGNESSLFSCPANSIGSHNCQHGEDVGVMCYSKDFSTCFNGDIKLWSSYNSTPENEGIVLICTNSTWYPLHHNSNRRAAEIACNATGYSRLNYVRSNAGKYYGYYYYPHYRYTCLNSDESLLTCSESDYGYQYYYSLGIKCKLRSLTESCTDGDIRLTGGTTDREGRVEYCYDNEWAPMCSLSTYTAMLICKRLGHTKWSLVISDERFGKTGVRSEFRYLYCSSSYTDLSECSVGTTSCTPVFCSVQYGLRCYDLTNNECTDGDIRLVDGDIEQEGRPEVCIDGLWGLICDNDWNLNDAYVTCLTLGFEGLSDPTVYYNSQFGSGFGPIFWSYVQCQHWTKSVYDCTKTTYPHFSCGTIQIAGVACTESCSDGDVRLVGGEFDNEGTVEVCFNYLWGLISDAGWSKTDALVVCNQLGHRTRFAKPILSSFYGKPNKTIHLQNVTCLGVESDLSECTNIQLSLFAGKQLLPKTDVAGVDCIYDEPTPPPCIVNPDVDPSDSCNSKGSFRLTKNGIESTSEGRVEYCNGEFWTPLCSMDNRAAAVACKQLGHTQYQWGAVIVTGIFPSLLNYSLVLNITCTGLENTIAECSVYEPVDSCLPWCPNNIGLKCFDPGLCEEGSVRLADGVIEEEGRVEVCVNGVWGSVCHDGWDRIDAHVVCQQIGYEGKEPIAYHNSYFGESQFPIVYSNFKCYGWEHEISECKKDGYYEFLCTPRNVAGLLCGSDCRDDNIRLTGGNYESEGTVEVCYENIWGLIEEAGWTQKDAEIVCRQLGYGSEGSIAMAGSFYGKPNRTVHLSDVQCNGDEERIGLCTHTKYSLTEGRQKLDVSNIAGVKCFNPFISVLTQTPLTTTQTVHGGSIDSLDHSAQIAAIVLGASMGLMTIVIVVLVLLLIVSCRKGHTKRPRVTEHVLRLNECTQVKGVKRIKGEHCYTSASGVSKSGQDKNKDVLERKPSYSSEYENMEEFRH